MNLLKPTAKRAMSAPPVKRNALTASKVSADPNSSEFLINLNLISLKQ